MLPDCRGEHVLNEYSLKQPKRQVPGASGLVTRWTRAAAERSDRTLSRLGAADRGPLA